MKLFSLASFLASLTAAGTLPVRLELAGYMLFAAAVIVVMIHDYSSRPLLRFETAAPAAQAFAARLPAPRRTAGPRVTFRAPALAAELNRLAA